MAPCRNKITKAQIERVSRMYKSNLAASAALGIAAGSLRRLCTEYGVESPYQRTQRLTREAQEERKGKTNEQ